MVKQAKKNNAQLAPLKEKGSIAADSNKCKTCNKVFISLQSCLVHEMLHLNMCNNGNNGNNSNNTNKTGKKKRKRHFSDARNDEDTPEQKEFKTFVRTALSLCEEGTELNILCRLFQPVPENLNCVYERIYYDLLEELKLRGKWEIQPFGSTVTGMAFKCSDIDFYIENLNKKNEPGKKILRQVAKILHSSGKFANILCIHTARVPIIKCTHIVTGYNLDVNVTSKLGVYNSRFIGKLLSYDKRIHPLMLIIKIWANSWGLTRTGRMTNYCLNWLVFFYLQNCEPSILPAVKDLQDGVPESLINGINFAFNEENKMNPLNTQNIKQVVEGFFKFYATFDFQKYIISPYLGKTILREDFRNGKFSFPDYHKQLEFLKQEFNTKAIETNDFHANELNCNTLIVVQDPFILNQNKSTTVGPRVFNRFTKQIQNANNIFSDPKSNELSSSVLLIKLFYETPSNVVGTSAAELARATLAPLVGRNMMGKSNMCKFNPVETELIYVRNYLRKHFPQQTFDKIEVNKFWTEKIVEFISEILQDFFKIKMTSLQTPTPHKAARSTGQTDVYNSKCSVNCELEASVDFWSARKNDVKKGYAAFLQEQAEITKKYEIERTGNVTFSTKLQCILSLQSEVDFSSVTLTMEDMIPSGEKSSFKLFFTEFTSRMRNFFKAFFERLSREHI